MSRKVRLAELLLLVWVVCSTIVGRTFTALIPPHSDATLFAYIGMEWLHGRLPYVHIWDLKPPGIFAVIALVFSLFPKSFTALAFAEGVFILGCVGMVYLLMRQCGAPPRAVWLATLAAAIACNLQTYNEHGNLTEIYLLWPAALSMYFFMKSGRDFQSIWVFLAGFFTGVASLFKPIGLSPLLAQCAFMFLLVALFRRLTLKHFVTSVLVNGIGALFAWLPFAVYFAVHGALWKMIDASLIAPVQYGEGGKFGILHTVFVVAARLGPLSTLVVCAIAGLTLMWTVRARLSANNPRPKEERWPPFYFFWPLILLWVLFDLLGSLGGGRDYPHYFLCLTSSLSVAGGYTYAFLIERMHGDTFSRSAKNVMFAIIVGPLFFSQASDVRDVLRLALGREQPVVRPWEKLANQLNAIRRPSDTLFVWDYLPGIYYATEMKSPTRHLFGFHIFESPEFHKRLGDEILRELVEDPPTFVVDGARETDGSVIDDLVYRHFHDFIDARYSLVEKVEDLRLYRLRPDNKSLTK